MRRTTRGSCATGAGRSVCRPGREQRIGERNSLEPLQRANQGEVEPGAGREQRCNGWTLPILPCLVCTEPDRSEVGAHAAGGCDQTRGLVSLSAHVSL